ncbi:hypothetical protein V494_08487 [Pseudogymnoascus sp. VKM F-4513 (FW-928)]|nr:hypothetical protein V494_08487 [Pseudogymnoascus sp. VKM F-4513 (FW-928)]
MATRAAARREAEFLADAIDGKSLLAEKSAPVTKKPKRTTKKASVGSTQVITDSKVVSNGKLNKELVVEPLSPDAGNNALSANIPVPPNKGVQDKGTQGKDNGANGAVLKTPAKRASRKRKIVPTDGAAVNGEIVKGGWDELPHNLGPAGGNNEEESPVLPVTPPDSIPRKKTRTSRAKKTIDSATAIKEEKTTTPWPEAEEEESLGITGQEDTQKVAPKPKRKLAATKAKAPATKRVKLLEADDNPNDADDDVKDQKPKKTRSPRVAKTVDTSQDVQDEVDKLIEGNEILKKAKKPKKNKYGLTPGVTPYPDFAMPTAEACLEVKNLLSGLHGVVEPPTAIPPPSLEVTGCGEVPSVLDALIRTRLSAATTSKNSAYAFAGLVSTFGILQEGIGKGSVNWNKVREASVAEVETAIKRGGLAKTKSIDIKKILDMVHEQNIARREAFIKEKESGEKVDVVGGESLAQGQKDLEIAVADKEILSLQYMHGLTPDEAMEEFTKYPGIGVKTASCVILFCLRRPSFAVDTHVFRLCKWLKWIPDKATRDSAFSHCEVRVPNEYKYSLHQLFIRHGRTCGRCRASTSETSEAWKETACPIDHLVERTGLRKILKPVSKMKKKKNGGDGESDSEMSELDDEMFKGYEWNDAGLTPEAEKEK